MSGPPVAKLLDFGLAKAAAPLVAGADLSMLPTTPAGKAGLTQHGTILGTFQYMAPEQIEGRDADARTDIFAFGAVLYEMLTGRKAFEGKSHASLIGAIMHAEPAPLLSVQPLTPRSVERQGRETPIAVPPRTPDGRRLAFSSERGGIRNLFWQAADGTGTAERLSESVNLQDPSAVSPDGTRLIFHESTATMGVDLMQLDLDDARASRGSASGQPAGTRRVTPLVQTPFSERNGIISPDGRWLAYEANDSGQFEIYVRPYPDVSRGLWQVSTGGGTRPLWSRTGQELFYLSPTGALMRVGVERGPTWAAGAPAKLLNEGYFTVPGGNPGRTYDISLDGQRFLMIKAGGGSDQAAAPQIVVVQHWTEELKRLVPVN